MGKKFTSGIALFLFSYSQYLLPANFLSSVALTVFWGSFMTGIILISDSILIKIKNKSFLHIISRNKKSLITFLIISTIGGIELDAFIQWLGKLWIYPYFSNKVYIIVFIGGFAIYWLMITESYLAIKSIIDSLQRGKKIVTKPFKHEKQIFNLLGYLGIAIAVFSTILIYTDYHIKYGGYYFDINTIRSYKVNFAYILSAFLGIWLCLERIQYTKNRCSFMKNVLHGYYTPLISILIDSFLLALIMESENISCNYWTYINWPYENITLLGLPVSMFLSWPLHYIAFLSLFRTFSDKISEEIWKGDVIS